jgi:hypothetical protein
MNAWAMGAQEKLIADATVIGDRLLILSCAMEKLEVPFDTLRLFAKAHGMDLDAYLDAVADAIANIPKIT